MREGEKAYSVDILPGPIPLRELFRDVWRHRELITVLASRDIRVRYKQTALGVLWAIVRPAVATFVFTFVFGNVAGLPSGTIPYPLLALSGVLAWSLFSEGVSAGSQSMLVNPNLVTKVYFPRIIMPMSATLRGLVDFAVAATFYFALAWIYGMPPGWKVAFLPIAVLYALFVSTGFTLWFSVLGVRYRDVAHALPFVLQALFWISPVGYAIAAIPERWAVPYWCNPLTSVIAIFRVSLLNEPLPETPLFLLSVAVSIIVFTGGLSLFRRAETRFADVI
ncbi:MAG: ABC transporter permease [Bacteroidota bacterium]|nr:ABC transporter permease [Bacteroidota bacterium]